MTDTPWKHARRAQQQNAADTKVIGMLKVFPGPRDTYSHVLTRISSCGFRSFYCVSPRLHVFLVSHRVCCTYVVSLYASHDVQALCATKEDAVA